MQDTKTKSHECMESHLKAAQHFVAAAYFQQQAAASHLSGHEDEAKKHSAKSHEEAAMAQKIAACGGKAVPEKEHAMKK